MTYHALSSRLLVGRSIARSVDACRRGDCESGGAGGTTMRLSSRGELAGDCSGERGDSDDGARCVTGVAVTSGTRASRELSPRTNVRFFCVRFCTLVNENERPNRAPARSRSR